MPWHGTLIDSEIFSVHAALVPSGAKGKVVMLGGSEHNELQGGTDEAPALPANVDRTAVYDVDARTAAVKILSPSTDVFCSGHAFTADGRLLIAGGTEVWGGEVAEGPGGGHVHWHGNFGGHRACWVFNQDRQTWDRAADLRFATGAGKGGGRWYPTVVTLPSGDLAAFGGHPSRLSEHWHENDLPERYWASANAWSWYPNAFGFEHPTLPGNWYPRANLVTGGLIFFTSKHDGKCRLFDPNSGALTSTLIDPPGGGYEVGWDYAVIQLPLVPGDGYRSRIMAVNEVQPRYIELDLSAGAATPTWSDAGTRQGSAATKRRVFACPVYLPTGQIFVSGGINGTLDSQAVKEPEIFTPNVDASNSAYQPGDIGTWQTIAEAADRARNYHSVALLLPDGSVFVSGSNINGSSGDPAVVAQRNIELFLPDYYNASGRPVIDEAPPLVTSAEETFAFRMASAAQANAIAKVALVRCGSVTHAADYDQRYVALQFSNEAGSDTITATLPGDASVLPPGYYMLWAVNSSGLPCHVAPFVRVAHVSCEVVTDRSTFSQEEVESFPGAAAFPYALYAMFDGFLAEELPAALGVDVRWADTNAPIPASQIAISATEGRWYEHSDLWTEVAQRVTYPFTVTIHDPGVFTGITDTRAVRVTFSHGIHSCSATFDLSLDPNPYMIDIDPAVQNPHWLSTDVRTFRVRAGETILGDITHGSGANAPETFARALIDRLRSLPNDAAHPFLALPREGDAAAVDLAPFEGSTRVYNYAVAKVRYRAVTTTAARVKAFFRLCTTAATGLEYDPSRVYRHSGGGPDTVPLLGKAGAEVASVPFFLSPRVETRSGSPGAASMATQPLAANYEYQDVAPTAGSEVTAYFAAWLDINQPDVARFPLMPGSSDGPWAADACQPIQEFFRSPHQCLVAEIYYEPDATNSMATPGTSDNLAQRNLALLHSDNPGASGSHHVVHPFEVKPSAFKLPPLGAVTAPVAALDTNLTARFASQRYGPDELIINWGNLPRDSEVTLYFSNVDTSEISQLAGLFRRSPPPYEIVDDRTLRFRVANHTWVPIPGGGGENLPALLSVRLPDSVVSGQRFRISIHQVDGRTHRILGSVEFSIPVTKAALIIDREVRNLSILKHIALTIPSTNRWYPIFQRYLGFLGERVDALGGDSSTIHPNPDGSGRPPREPGADQADIDRLVAAIKACCARYAWAPLAIVVLLAIIAILLLAVVLVALN